ncbi:MAG TPA: ABC transporter ATP-binding protein [Mycobacteriales bacterium]|jgi:ABC-2 type transport system ATP-binding protein|nr:ABC transporter ATP-binding protein [Mycobacteriales bacterium]
MSATPTLTATGLGKRYGRKWALRGCTVEIPAGRVAGLVGPNGAGKTTLLHCAVGLLAATEGSVTVLGGRPAADVEQLGKVGFLAQDAPVYGSLSIADHLKFGARMNPKWDGEFARDRIDQLGLDPKQRAGKLSGGQRAQVALTLALAKRPEVLVLDEPVAALDPLARRDFLATLASYVAEHGIGVIMSSHLLADLERVCDFLVLVSAARVQLADDVDDLLATHRRIIGPRRDLTTLPGDQHVVWESHTDKQTTAVVRATGPIHDPAWQVEELSLEDVVLAYMGGAGEVRSIGRTTMGVVQ